MAFENSRSNSAHFSISLLSPISIQLILYSSPIKLPFIRILTRSHSSHSRISVSGRRCISPKQRREEQRLLLIVYDRKFHLSNGPEKEKNVPDRHQTHSRILKGLLVRSSGQMYTLFAKYETEAFSEVYPLNKQHLLEEENIGR